MTNLSATLLPGFLDTETPPDLTGIPTSTGFGPTDSSGTIEDFTRDQWFDLYDQDPWLFQFDQNAPPGGYDPSPEDGFYGLKVTRDENTGDLTWETEVVGYFDMVDDNRQDLTDASESTYERGRGGTVAAEDVPGALETLSKFTPLESDAIF